MAADLASAPVGQPQRIENLPADPELRERLLAHGLTEFMLRHQQAAEIRVTST